MKSEGEVKTRQPRVCVRAGDRDAPCLFHWLSPVTAHHQHTKRLKMSLRLSFTPSSCLILSITLITDCFSSSHFSTSVSTGTFILPPLRRAIIKCPGLPLKC